MMTDILDLGIVFERPTEGDDGGYSDGGQPPEKKPLPPPAPDTSGQYNGPNGEGYDGAIPGAAGSLAGGDTGGSGQGASEPPPDGSEYNGPNGGGYTPPEAQAGADEPPPSYGDTNGPNGEGYSPPAAQAPEYAHDTNGSDGGGGTNPAVDDPRGYGTAYADEPPPTYTHDTNGSEGPSVQDTGGGQDFGTTNEPSVAEMEAQGQQFTPQVPESTYQADTNQEPMDFGNGRYLGPEVQQPLGQTPTPAPSATTSITALAPQALANPGVQENIARAVLNTPMVGPALTALGSATAAQAAGSEAPTTAAGTLGRAGQSAAYVLGQINRSLSGSVGAAREMSTYTDTHPEATARMNDLTHIPDSQDFETLGGIVSAGAQGFEKGFRENAQGGYQPLIDERGKIDDGLRSLGIEPDSGAGRFIKAAAPIVLDVGGDLGNYVAAPLMDTAGLLFKPLGKVLPGAEKVYEATRSREAITHIQAEKAADVVSTLAEGTTLQQAGSGARAAAEDLQKLGRQDNAIGTALDAISSPDTPVIGSVIRKVEAAVGKNPAALNNEATKVRSVLETVEANKTAGTDIANADLVAIAKGDLSSDAASLIPIRDQKTLVELNKPVNGVRPLEQAVKAQAAAASNIERAVNVVADAEPIVGAELKTALAAVDLTDVSKAREALQPIIHDISTLNEKAATQLEHYVDALVNHPLDAASTTYLRAFAEKNGYKLNPAGWQRAWGEFTTMQKQAFLSLDMSYLLNNGLDMGTKAIVMEHALPAGLASAEKFAAGHGVRLPERVIGDVGSKAAEAGGHGSAAADIIRRTDRKRGFERAPLFGSVVAKGRHLSSYVNDQPFIRGIWKKSVQRSMEAGLPRLAQRAENIARSKGVDTSTAFGKGFLKVMEDALLSAEGSAPAKVLRKGQDYIAQQVAAPLSHEVGQGPVATFAEKLATEVRAIPVGPGHEAAVKAVVSKYRSQVQTQGVEDALRRTVGLDLQGKAIDFHKEMETAQRGFLDAVAAQDGVAAAKHANDVFSATRGALAEIRNATGEKVKGLFQTHGLPQEEWNRVYADLTNEGYQHQIDSLTHALEILQTAGIKDVGPLSPEGLRVVKKVQQGLIAKVREAQRMSSGIVDELAAARKVAKGAKARDLSLNIDEEWNILDEWVAKQGQAANEAIDAGVQGTGFTVDRTAKTAWEDAQTTKRAQDAEARAAHDQVTALFDRMEQAARDRASGAAVDPAEFAAQKLPMENALKAIVQARTNFGEYATVKGIRDADRTAFDYVSGKTNLDRVLDKVALFSMWQTRNPGYWVDAVVRNPAVGNVMLQYMQKTEAERNRRGLPPSYIGSFSLGKVPDDFPVLGGHEIFVNPFLPSFSILEQGVQVSKAYWASQAAQSRLAKAKAAGGDTTAAQGDYNNSLTDFYSAIGGGISPNPILLDTATVFGLLGDRIIGNFGVAVPGSDIFRAGATLATGESTDLFKATGLQNLVTQAQYKAIHQAPPLHGDKAYDISVMTALADMRTEGRITQAELYGAIEAKIRGDEGNGALQGAMQLAGTENKYRSVASAAGLGAKTLRMPTAATTQYYGDKANRASTTENTTFSTAEPVEGQPSPQGPIAGIKDEVGMMNRGGFYAPSTSPDSIRAHQATTYTDSQALARLSRLDAEYNASPDKREFLKPTVQGMTPAEIKERQDYAAFRDWRKAQPGGTPTFLSDYVKAGMPGASAVAGDSIVQPNSSAATAGATISNTSPTEGAQIKTGSKDLGLPPDQIVLGYATDQISGPLTFVDRNRVEGYVGNVLDERRKVFEGAAGTSGAALSDRLDKLDKPGRDAYLKTHAKDADVQALYAGYDAESAWVRTGSPSAVIYGKYATWSADQHYPDTADIKAGGGQGKIAEFVSDLQKGKVRDAETAHTVQPTFGAVEPATAAPGVPAPGVAAPEGVDPFVQAARDKQVINEARIATSHSQPVADAVQAIYDAHTEAETKASGFFKKVVEPALKSQGLLDTYNAENKAQDALVPAPGVAATPQQTVALWYKAFKAEVSDAAKRGGLTYEQQKAGAEPTPEQFLEWIQRNRGQAGMATLRKAGGAVAPSTPAGGSGGGNGTTATTPPTPTGPLQGPGLGNTPDFRNRPAPDGSFAEGAPAPLTAEQIRFQEANTGDLANGVTAQAGGALAGVQGATQADTSSQAAFVASVLPAAQDAERRTGIPASVIVAIAAHESNYGRAGGNMLYGIKGPGATMSTYEVEGGKDVPQNASFRTYPSVEAATQDFTDLVTTGRYAPAYQKFQQTGDAAQFVKDLQTAGYATDPTWGTKIERFTQGTIDPLVSAAGTGGAVMAARMPAQGPIVQGFGSTANVTGESHEGVDIQAAPGSVVSAPISGTVVFAGLDNSGQNGGGGVKILGADGKYYSVWHVQPGQVQAGQKVAAGDQIGTVAGDRTFKGNAVQPHVHFQVSTQQNGGFIDPQKAVAGGLPQAQTGVLQPRVPEAIRTQTPGQLQGGEPSRTGTPNTPQNTTPNTTPNQTASGDMNGGVVDTTVTEPSKTGAILANSGTTSTPNPGFDANNYVGAKGSGFVSVVGGQEKSFVDKGAAEQDFNARQKTNGGPGGVTPGFSPDDLVSPKISSGQSLKTILSSDADYETKRAQVELRLDAELDRIRAKRDSAPGYDEYNSSPDKKGWAKAHPEEYKRVQAVFEYEKAAKADPANALAAKYSAAASDEYGRFPDTKLARDHFVENVLQGVSKADGRAGNVTINLGPEKGSGASSTSEKATGPNTHVSTNRSSAPAAVSRYDRAISPSGTYTFRKGAEPPRTLTLQMMKDELSRANYGGPWDDAAVLAAYERTAKGILTSVDGGAAVVAPSSNPMTPPAVTRPSVDPEAERRKIAALVSNTPAATRSSDGALRGVWTKAGSALDFPTWLKIFREEAGKPLSFQALASRLLSK